MIRIIHVLLLATASMLISAACLNTTSEATTPGTEEQNNSPEELIILTHDSFDIGEDVIKEFEVQYNAKINIVKAGDAGEVLNKSILSKGNPLGDVLYGIDNTFLTRALDEQIFIPYRSPALSNVPAQYHLDVTNHVMPINYGFVAINYDKQWIENQNLTPPETLQELTSDKWSGKLVVQNPATSSPGLAFLLTTIAQFGETGTYTYTDYWQDLKDNQTLVKNGWSDAYYGDFTMAGGDRPLVVSYTTSPAAEVYYSEGAFSEPPTGNVLGPETAFLQIEGAGILVGTPHVELAQRFIDFAMGTTFQQDFPARMWVFPVNPEAVLDETFAAFAEAPLKPATIDPHAISENRAKWIDEWAKIMLR